MTASVDIDVSLKLAQFESQMQQMRGSMDAFTKTAKKAGDNVNSVFAGMKAAGAAAAAAFTFEEAKSAVKNTLDWADGLAELSARLGTSTTALQRIQAQGIKFNSSAEGMTAAFKSFNDIQGLATAGNAKAQKALGLLGDEFNKVAKSGAPTEEVFLAAVNAISQYDDASTRAAVANKVLGESGADIVQGFRDGGQSVADLTKEMRSLTVVSDAQIQKAAELNDKWEEFSRKMELASKGWIINSIERIDKLKNSISDLIEAFKKTDGFSLFNSFGASAMPEFNRLQAMRKNLARSESESFGVLASNANARINGTGKPSGAGSLGKDGEEGSSKLTIEYDNSQLEKSEYIIKQLRGQLALTREQAAGVVGNLFHESAGLKTNAISKDGHNSLGLAQWTDGRRKELEQFARDRGKVATDFNTQVDFLVKELQTTERTALARLRKTDNSEDATLVFGKAFERPKAELAHNDRRVAAAETAYLGGLTKSERSFDDKAEADAAKERTKLLEDRQKQLERVAETTRQLRQETAAIGREDDLQLQKQKELADTLERNGLFKKSLTADEKALADEIRRGVDAKYAAIAANDKEKLSYEEKLQAIDDDTAKQQELTRLTIDYKNALEEVVSDEQFTDLLTRLNQAYKEGQLSLAQYTEATAKLGTEFRKSQDVTEKSTSDMSEFAKQAARNMQDSFSNFLFDPFKNGLKGMVDGFADSMRQIAAQWLANKAMESIFGAKGDGSGGLIGSLGSAMSSGGSSSGSWLDSLVSVGSSLFSSMGSFATGTPEIKATGLYKLHEGEAVIPAAANKRGMSPYGHNSGSGGIVINQNITVGQNADKAQVKASAAQGAREALAYVSAAGRYK